MVSLITVAVFLLWGLVQPPWTTAFKPYYSRGSLTHREITEKAILRKTAQVCRDIAIAEGKDFPIPIDNTLTVSAVQNACSKLDAITSTKGLGSAIFETYNSNAAVDINQFSSARHCDAEEIQEGQAIITDGMESVKKNIDEESYFFARISLGMTLHTLQDFYSHSNWVELGNTVPFSSMIKNVIISNIAGPNVKTCTNCKGTDCSDNLLPELKKNNILTSGYFSLILSSKPEGKCSHGGDADKTSTTEPTGGINKDEIKSDHGMYHKQAADLAISATMELLEDIRLSKGNSAFLRLVGMNKTSVLAFVMDTTGSMSDEIEEAKRVSINIIDSRKASAEKPSEYILVPFNDPDFGPLIRTRNAELFKKSISLLTASGGGDEPEMCLSGLQLALAAAPPSTDIYIFTDAGAKDKELESTIKAMTENTKSRLNFMLTKTVSFRKKRGASQSQRSSRAMAQPDLQMYRDLAQASGGQAIEVTKSTLSQATAVIMDSSSPALVTVLQIVRSPNKPENFSFVLDRSLSNVTMYITGVSPIFTLYSPTGVSQSGSVRDGPLASIQTVGNLWRVQLNSENQTAGEWRMSMNSTNFYTFKVICQSSVNFLFNFVEIEGLHGDFAPKDNRPFNGGNGTLFLSVTGSESVTVTDVLLVEASGTNAVSGTIQSLGGTDYLVHIQRIPEWAFVVQLKGLLTSSSRSSADRFQRQSPTQQRGSGIKMTAESQSTLRPGIPLNVNFRLTSNGTAVNYTIRARNDRGFNVSVPSFLSVNSGGSAQGTATLTAPSNTESGTDVTLTIEAEAPGSTDLNYVSLRLTVMAEVTDVSRPVCQIVSTKADCPVECSSASWELSANLTDGNGTGIVRVFVNLGNGTLSLSPAISVNGTNVTLAFYNASCCSQEVELVAVDGVGKVGTCFTSIKKISASTTTVVPITTSTLLPATKSTLKPSTNTTSSSGFFLMFSKYLLLGNFMLAIFVMF